MRCCERVADGSDRAARSDMALAASAAGRAFGQAGVHIPHACSYPVAGLKHEWKPPGYPGDDRFVPHGFAVVVTAPAAFRFTEPAAPERHRARRRAAHRASPSTTDDHDALPRAFEQLMRDTGAPAQPAASSATARRDIPALVDGRAQAAAAARLLALRGERRPTSRPSCAPACDRGTQTSDLFQIGFDRGSRGGL